MPEYVGKTRDESCNRNTDIKRGDRRKRDRERERQRKKEETSKSGGDYRHLFFTWKVKEKKTKKQKTIYRATQECATE